MACPTILNNKPRAIMFQIIAKILLLFLKPTAKIAINGAVTPDKIS